MCSDFALVSILIPVYNTASYLDRCISSVLKQTYPNLEILLVDDGSTDQSSTVCEKYLSQCKLPVRYWRTEHLGVANARQLLIDNADGDYFFFLDSDDFIDSHTIEILYSLAIKYSADMVQASMERTTTSELPKIDYQQCNIEVYKGEMTVVQFCCGTAGLLRSMLASKLYRRSIFSGIKMPIGKIHEDEAVMHHLVGNCDVLVCVDLPLYRYYNNPDSLMRKTFSLARYNLLDALQDRIVFCQERNLELAATMNKFRYCLECVKLYRNTVEYMGKEDVCLLWLKEKYDNMSKELLETGNLDNDLNTLLENWQTNPFSGEVPNYFEIARKYYNKHFEDNVQ